MTLGSIIADDTTPPIKYLILNGYFFTPSMISTDQAKNAQPEGFSPEGGSAPHRAGDPPAEGRVV